MVSAREKLSKCAMWEVDRRVLNELKDTGFDHLYELSKYVGRCHHDNRMIQTLIDNYDMDHCVFRVNGRDMLLGLEDVAYLTGLNIDGKLVVSSKEKINALGAVPSVMKKNGCAVRMSWLKDTFEKVPEGVGDSELEKYVSAFALYIVGTVILPTSDHVYVSLQYLDCLSKDKIKENAWGVAMLAHIHHCLKQYKINKMAAIGAHMHLLMVWALEHFPKFARELLSDDIVVPLEFPLSCSWAQLISKVLQKKYEIKKKNYQQHLVNLGNDDSDNKFVSMPYRRVLDLPPRLLEQLEMATYVGPLVHPMHKKILPDHRPDLCPDQLGFERAVVSDSPSLLKKTCEYRSWRLHQNAWKKRKERLMRDSDAAEEQHRESPASARSTQGTHFQEQHVQYPASSRSTQGTHLQEQHVPSSSPSLPVQSQSSPLIETTSSPITLPPSQLHSTPPVDNSASSSEPLSVDCVRDLFNAGYTKDDIVGCNNTTESALNEAFQLLQQGPEDENRHAGDLGNSTSNTLDELEQVQQHEHEQQQQDEFENQRPQQPDVDMPNVDPVVVAQPSVYIRRRRKQRPQQPDVDMPNVDPVVVAQPIVYIRRRRKQRPQQLDVDMPNVDPAVVAQAIDPDAEWRVPLKKLRSAIKVKGGKRRKSQLCFNEKILQDEAWK